MPVLIYLIYISLTFPDRSVTTHMVCCAPPLALGLPEEEGANKMMRLMESAEDAELRREATALHMQDILVAAKELFDLCPGTRQIEVRVTDDGVVLVSAPHE